MRKKEGGRRKEEEGRRKNGEGRRKEEKEVRKSSAFTNMMKNVVLRMICMHNKNLQCHF